MKSHFIAAAATVLSFAAAPAAPAADYTIVSLDQPYSERALAAICQLENGLPYHGAEGVYGCTNGMNNVECHDDRSCTAFITGPFAVTGAGRTVGAEAVLRMPLAPAGCSRGRALSAGLSRRSKENQH
jgi:hypothetical protein